MEKTIKNIKQIQDIRFIKGEIFKPKIKPITYNWFEKTFLRCKDLELLKGKNLLHEFCEKGEGLDTYKVLYKERSDKLDFLDFNKSTLDKAFMKSKLIIYFINKESYTYTGTEEDILKLYQEHKSALLKNKVAILETNMEDY